ncbi:MAG: hypothetical protein DRP87_09650 [Spirochaetes bacterium]|nr:MAG: hypothetical protein DRP87_09650 [Spirochaetota bacterium]
MCPDDRRLSAYFDGEIPEALQQSVVQHIEECSLCSGKLKHLTEIRRELKEAPEPNLEDSMDRVWRKIQSKKAEKEVSNFWNRKIYIPVPVASAAIFLFLVLAISFIILLNKEGENDVAEVPIQEEVINVNVKNLEELLEYLNSQDTVVEVTIRLPEEHIFHLAGEPRLLRAVDYKGK